MSGKNRNHAVDAIKGIMMLLIVIHHSQLLPFLHHGYLGVDVFFVISGFFLMRHYLTKGGSAMQYTLQKVRVFYLPYLLCLLLACILDYKHLTSFSGFEGFLETYAPFAAFLTLTEEIGFIFHAPVILVGGWFLSVLVIAGFLLYTLLDYSETFTRKVILPFAIVLGFTFYFSKSASVESFSVLGALSFPLLRGFLEMGMGILLYAFVQNQKLSSGKIAFFTCAGLILFVMMLFAKRSLDSILLISVPFLLLGAVCPESGIAQKYNGRKYRLLAGLGEMSLEISLVHPPVLHIVHSLASRLSAINPLYLVPVDVLVIIVAAILLRWVCKKIRGVLPVAKCSSEN